MKKTITMITLALGLMSAKAQTPTVADFESFTLGTDTFYENHSSLSWLTNNAKFRYFWDTSFGGLWSGGFSYTNKNNVVSSSYTNMYAAITGKGYNNSGEYATAWEGYAPQQMKIVLTAPQQTVAGFYATNTTYAYKTMLNGGGPARKFGDTLHTHSGMQPGNYPDWFKFTVYGYKNGAKKQDSVECYLADYRFANNTQDYIVNTWKWVDCTTLGSVDSIFMKIYSSDNHPIYGNNDPAYFCMDDFTTLENSPVGLRENTHALNAAVYPNPFNTTLNITTPVGAATQVKITDIAGSTVYSETLSGVSNNVELAHLQAGIYFVELTSGDQKR